MARLEPLVDEVRRRFSLSTGSTDSTFPASLVPDGKLGPAPHPPVFLGGVGGGVLRVFGTYRARLQFPECAAADFTFNVVNVCETAAVLGMDFLHEFRMDIFDWASHRLGLLIGNERVQVPFKVGHEGDPDHFMIASVSRVISKQPHDLLSVVWFDLETTGLGADCEVVQLAAKWKETVFSVYILPQGNVHPDATKVNGLEKRGEKLYLRGQPVATTPIREALLSFIAMLRETGGNAVLAAHNAFGFDANVLLKMVASEGLMEQFQAVAAGFTDTLPLFRQQIPDRVRERRRFTLEALATDLLPNDTFSLHEAMEDVKVLEKLTECAGVTTRHLIETMKPLNNFDAFRQRRQ